MRVAGAGVGRRAGLRSNVGSRAGNGTFGSRRPGSPEPRWLAPCGEGASHLSPAGFGHDADGDPRRERDGDPSLARRCREPLLGVPAEHLRAREASGGADQHERKHAEACGAQPVAGDARLQRVDGVPSGKERRQTLRPVRKARERNRDATDDQHRQEDALPERLHRGHVVGHHRNHEAEPDERECDAREREEELERMPRQRHAEAHGEHELQQSRHDEEKIAGGDRARNERGRRDRRQPVAAPHTPLALAHHRRRQPEASPAERGDGQQLAHVPDERHLFEAIQHPERHAGRSSGTDSCRAAPSCSARADAG